MVLPASPTIYSTAYLKANIEGGQYFNWFYNDGNNDGRGFDPNGSGLQSRCRKATGSRRRATPIIRTSKSSPTNNCAGGGTTRIRRFTTPATGWVAARPANRMAGAVEVDRDARIWLRGGRQGDQSAERLLRRQIDRERDALLVDLGQRWRPRLPAAARRHDPGARACRRSTNTGTSTATTRPSGAGVVMVQFAFSCVWNWDARPFPTFPADTSAMGRHRQLERRRLVERAQAVAAAADADAAALVRGLIRPSRPFRSSAGRVHVKPKFSTLLAEHVSGRETRAAQRAYAYLRHRTDLRGSALGRGL